MHLAWDYLHMVADNGNVALLELRERIYNTGSADIPQDAPPPVLPYQQESVVAQAPPAGIACCPPLHLLCICSLTLGKRTKHLQQTVAGCSTRQESCLCFVCQGHCVEVVCAYRAVGINAATMITIIVSHCTLSACPCSTYWLQRRSWVCWRQRICSLQL